MSRNPQQRPYRIPNQAWDLCVPERLGVDSHTGYHLVRSMGALSLRDGSDRAWLREDPESFLDIVSPEIDQVIRYAGCSWWGAHPQVAAVDEDGRCFGIGIAALKTFRDGLTAVNLTYAVRAEARGASLGAVLSGLATFDLRRIVTSRGGTWPSDGIVNVQTRAGNDASRNLALGMGMELSPEHSFVARLNDGRDIEYVGYDLPLPAFLELMAERLSDRVVLAEANDPLAEILDPIAEMAEQTDHQLVRERQR